MEIPPSFMEAVWAQLILLITTVVGFVIAYIENQKKKEVIAFFDPKDNTAYVPPEGVEERSWKMNDETKKFLTCDLNAADAESALKQVAEAEAAGKIEYTITLPKWSFMIEYGLIKGSTNYGK
jgi:hypothetical protein